MVRDNPVKARLAAGGTAAGAMVFDFLSPGLPQIAVNAGADFLLYDMEHTGTGFETLKVHAALCRGLPIVPLVRVPRGEYAFIARALDIGAMGVMVPMVGSAPEAQHVVACTRYPPAGKRGAAFGFAHDDFCGDDVGQTMRSLDARTLVIAQIETDEGLANVDAIASVPGIDALWIGHFDLTNFLGIPGQFSHPRFIDAIERVLEACRKHDVAPAILVSDDEAARRFGDRGFRMMAHGIDQLMLQQAMRRSIALLREVTRRAPSNDDAP